MREKRKKKTWLRFRHRVVWRLGGPLLFPLIRRTYGVDVEQLPEEEKRQCLILINHQTMNDPFFVAMAFRRPVYFLANENLFSNGFLSSLLRFLVAPIPIRKQTIDVQAVKTLVQVAREGGTLSMSPEGNRTYSGETGYINPAVTKLVKLLKLPVLLFRIEGGYGVQPRWSDVVRRGKMRAYVSRVLEPEEIRILSNEELYKIICEELYVKETGEDGGCYYHRKSAEYLERALYVCPDCGLSEFGSHRDRIACRRCGKEIRYLPSMELQGVGFSFPFGTVTEWYRYQCDYMNRLDVREYVKQSLYQDEITLLEVIPCKKKRILYRRAQIILYGDRIELWQQQKKEMTFDFAEMDAVTILEANRLNIYRGSSLYQIKGTKRFNALKYLNTYHRARNLRDGTGSGFLGL